MSQSVDAMLGIINNANQTNTIIDAQRNIAENQRSANERGMTAMINTLVGENNKTDNLINMHSCYSEIIDNSIRKVSRNELKIITSE